MKLCDPVNNLIKQYHIVLLRLFIILGVLRTNYMSDKHIEYISTLACKICMNLCGKLFV